MRCDASKRVSQVGGSTARGTNQPVERAKATGDAAARRTRGWRGAHPGPEHSFASRASAASGQIDIADAERDRGGIGPPLRHRYRRRISSDQGDQAIEPASTQFDESETQHGAGEINTHDPAARRSARRGNREVRRARAEIHDIGLSTEPQLLDGQQYANLNALR